VRRCVNISSVPVIATLVVRVECRRHRGTDQADLRRLTYAADKVLHLNLKPENVLIAANGSIKVTDFGLDEVVTVIPRGRSRACPSSGVSCRPSKSAGPQPDPRPGPDR